MLLQIHDELLFEAPCNGDDIKALKGVVERCCGFEVARDLKLKVDLALHMQVGKSWGSAMGDLSS